MSKLASCHMPHATAVAAPACLQEFYNYAAAIGDSSSRLRQEQQEPGPGSGRRITSQAVRSERRKRKCCYYLLRKYKKRVKKRRGQIKIKLSVEKYVKGGIDHWLSLVLVRLKGCLKNSLAIVSMAARKSRFHCPLLGTIF